MRMSFAFLSMLLACSTTAMAHGPDKEEVVTPVLRQTLPPTVGHDVAIARVDYLPGQASTPHEHAGAIFAYVMEGTVISQLEGQAPKTYRKGDSWYEPPMTHHLVSKNASASAPATLLVFAVGSADDPIKQPIGASTGAKP